MVVPAAVQMGWVESPSHFCAVTEAARDLTQHFVDNNIPLPPDPLEDAMKIVDIPMRGRTRSPTKLLQVYVDDFCYAATQSEDGAHIPTIWRVAVHGIHAVFPPTSVTKHKDGKEPISAKKLVAGDGNFTTKKEMGSCLTESNAQYISYLPKLLDTSRKPVSCSGKRQSP